MGADGAENGAANYPDGLHASNAGLAMLLGVFQVPWNHALGIANEPSNFALDPVNSASADTDVVSATYTVAGLYAGESRPYQAAAGVYVSKNSGAFVLAGSGTVVNGDTLRVRIHSSATAAQTVSGSLTVGTAVATFSVTTAGTGTRDWQPTDLGSKLAAWWRVEDIVGADGADMVTWVDASGNGRALTAGGQGSGRPKVKASAINGFKAVQFSGALNGWLTPPAGLVTGRTSIATFFMSKSGADPNPTYYGAPIAGWGADGNDFWIYQNGGIYTGYGSDHRRDNMDPPGLATAWHQYMLLSGPDGWRIAQDGTTFSNDPSNVVAPRIGAEDRLFPRDRIAV
jgi:hypothetical protein